MAYVAVTAAYTVLAGITFFVRDARKTAGRHTAQCWEVACPGCTSSGPSAVARSLLAALAWPLVWLAFAAAATDKKIRNHYDSRPQGADE